ncbi:alpha/beta hydrolase family protein [Planctomicrobium sp. SH527]|uniref:alpha/beta hydrolase family protein n=1 Tax=Planctomicrobium sp. SH527 TaxID=3448123 RepID=UPI003F5CB92D
MRQAFYMMVVCLAVSVVNAAEPQPGVPEDVAFQAKVDGTEQRYVLIRPETTEEGPRDVLIALHGHGSDRWQFIQGDRGEVQGAKEFARRHQLIYVSPDYRAKTSWMGPKAEADLVQIIGELKARFPVRRVFLCGGSMGGTSALTFAALHPNLIAGVVSLNGTANHLEYDNFQEAISESFGGTKIQIPAEYKKRSAEYWPENFTMPVSVTTGGKDTIVPPESVLRLAGVLKQLGRPVLLIHRKDGGHSTNFEDTLAALEFVYQNANMAGGNGR